MFYAVNQRNIAISGKGTIDGSSELFHHEVSPGAWKRNHDQQITGRNILFVGCKDVSGSFQKWTGVVIKNGLLKKHQLPWFDWSFEIIC